jgi:hypothetical protein
MRNISNRDDVIDSRDIIQRIDDLEFDVEILNEDELEELQILKDLAEDASDSPDWKCGETLISDDYFEDYAKELAQDNGDINGGEGWPFNCIDWEEAADQLKQDYFDVDFDGVTYWVRA